jgi:tetratricopeptide (TPR) repeat protein
MAALTSAHVYGRSRAKVIDFFLTVLDAVTNEDRTGLLDAKDRYSTILGENFVRYEIGVALYDLGYYEEGIGEIRGSFENEPTVGKAEDLAPREADLGNMDQASRLYSYILNENPDNGYALAGQAWVFAEAGRFDEAKKMATLAVESTPTSSDIKFDQADIWLRSGDVEAAIGMFQAALALSKNPTIEVLNHLAYCHSVLGHETIACSYAKQVLKVDPSDQYARAFFECESTNE